MRQCIPRSPMHSSGAVWTSTSPDLLQLDRWEDLARVDRKGNLLDIFDGVAEQEEVFLSDSIADFDVCAVERAYRDRAIHHEFHVARA